MTGDTCIKPAELIVLVVITYRLIFHNSLLCIQSIF